MLPRTLICIALFSTLVLGGDERAARSNSSTTTRTQPSKTTEKTADPATRTTRTGQPNSDYRIGPGDVLDVAVWDNEDLSRTVPVRPDGKISLPLLDDVQAAGLTPEELQSSLKKRLAEYVESPELSVIVKEVNSRTFSVMGKVNAAGEFKLNGTTTIVEALARAGGLAEFASPSRVFVLRRNGPAVQRIAYNYRKYVLNGHRQAPLYLQPGDVVVVP
jgi:polysaccharide biosynthesis/export protein